MSTTYTSCFRKILTPLFDLYYVLEIITLGNYNGPVYGSLTLRYPVSSVPKSHTSCFRKILTPLFDLYYVLEIITFGNHNGPDAGPLTLLGPYIVSLVNANGPTDVRPES